MKTLQQIKQERESAQSKLFNDVRLFWAFGNKQFEEGLKKINLQESEKVIHIGMGGYLPKNNLDAFLNGMKKLNEEYETAIKAHKLRPKLIAYELANHECYYTGDIQPALDALGSEYTIEEVLPIYKENLKKWQDSNK